MGQKFLRCLGKVHFELKPCIITTYYLDRIIVYPLLKPVQVKCIKFNLLKFNFNIY